MSSEHERLDAIEDTIKDLTSKVAHLDKSFVEVNITLRDYAGWTKELSTTIKELSSVVKAINESNQRVPYERILDIQLYTKPLEEVLRKHETEHMTKRNANTIATTVVLLVGLSLTIFGLFGDYVLEDMKEDILNSGKVNRVLIENNAKSIYEHNKVKERVLKSLHTHSEVP